ncbi:MAG: hypothetical protein A2504_03685 [Bdellovibrionales bacterium RIFOXYD12_FULL_39_22]|nr:MAG: hypothetical protein A2385_11435 [Bdellovibrionales bacterium RIFOXYB1_FULL_39_21]OFZ41679.1 MAG: hypothetical protein A2485_01745 [Bdellovibrionales bacterium RIFOXYC12_FULL_39_17]OFZ46079.1 MAG: hypothetical protein A2404_12110 [Bdellovibrionales bacterium RIFOXYC1_FULL_39_130]OFZ74906.1 MAG: hypothetical protein A2560_15150 [Bdellovibrionales bacterium RIFOXYD1_FULL_39_84]OFZ92759.1 MAG: hypothetical protein A2504_03685 [Bdellovibrionales bacterium RIFOXYD12_FULL_39_22]HLE12545.1 AT
MNKKTVIIVEDEAIIRLRIKSDMEQNNFEVIGHYASGEDALAAIEKQIPNLILMDIHLSGTLDGIETADLILQKHNLPLIFLTAHAEEETLILARAVNPYGYLLKPFTSDALRATVKMAIYKHQLDCDKLTLTRELQKKMDELLHLNNELKEFAHVISHDLKDPLAMVKSCCQQLQQKASDNLDEKSNNYLSYAIEGSRRMESLIDSLLEYSRIGKLEQNAFTPVDLQEVVAVAKINLSKKIVETNAQIVCAPLPTVKGNSSGLVQVFQNLLSNAIKFSPADPIIRIEYKLLKNIHQISVCDNGIGIPAESAEKVFQIFERLHSEEEYPGTGMGLTICRKIIKHHGGNIWVSNTSTKGTTIVFELPV